MMIRPIADLDLAELSLWLADLNVGPLIPLSFCSTICSITQSELELATIVCLIDSDKIVIVVEIFDGWEVNILLLLDWHKGF